MRMDGFGIRQRCSFRNVEQCALGHADELGAVDAAVSGEQIADDAGDEHIHRTAGAEQLDAHYEAGDRCIHRSAEDRNEAERSQEGAIQVKRAGQAVP
ncbi:hypothetical protein D3C71_1812920 [compost metagenome]